MTRAALLVLAVVVSAGSGAAWAPAQRLIASSLPDDAPEAKTFAAWLESVQRGRRTLAEEPLAIHRARVVDYYRWAEGDVGRERIATNALLDLYALCLSREAEAPALAPPTEPGLPLPPPPPPSIEEEVGEIVLRVLGPSVRAGGGLVAREVLPLRSQPVPRRLAAAWLLARSRTDGAALALAATLRGAEPELLAAALPALVGWDDPRVNALFALLWESPPGAERARALALVERHFVELSRTPHAPMDPAFVGRMTALLAVRLGGTDWREASRAVAIARALPDEAAVPPLIEALDLWTERFLAGLQARRVQAEIARDLERRSGRSIGTHAEGWRQWWRAVRDGRIPLDVADRGERRSAASFFGLRPSSDRLVFVLDRSGSMDWAFGDWTGTRGKPGRTRYEAACEQLLGFLRASGPRTRFTVVLFESRTEAWSRELRAADDKTLAELEGWLGARRPGGGTELRPAVLRAVGAEDGRSGGRRAEGIDPEALEIDTLIVLCDGETAEGGSWAASFAERLHDAARVAIHCVQIGPSGDGTLERLAAGTGGDYVRVDG